jgi:hypothetical protein
VGRDSDRLAGRKVQRTQRAGSTFPTAARGSDMTKSDSHFGRFDAPEKYLVRMVGKSASEAREIFDRRIAARFQNRFGVQSRTIDALADDRVGACIVLPLNFVALETARSAAEHVSISRSAKELKGQTHRAPPRASCAGWRLDRAESGDRAKRRSFAWMTV